MLIALKWHGRGSSRLGNFTVNSRSKNAAAASVAAKTLALQQRGPPIFAIWLSASQVACIDKDLSLSDVQAAFVAMLTAIPKPTAAPQAP